MLARVDVQCTTIMEYFLQYFQQTAALLCQLMLVSRHLFIVVECTVLPSLNIYYQGKK